MASEVFQTLKIDINSYDLNAPPITEQFISKVNLIKIKIDEKQYTVQKENQKWILNSNREINLKQKSLTKSLVKLGQIQIQQHHPNEPINVANFSLSTPGLELTLYTEDHLKKKIQVGLFNPLSLTSFITIDKSDSILEIQNTSNLFEPFLFDNLIDSKIFPIHLSSLEKLEIFNKYTRNRLRFTKNNENWVTNKTRTPSQNSVNQIINSILSIKATHILDNLGPEELENLKKKIVNGLLYKIIVKRKNQDDKIEFTFNSILSPISGVKFDPKTSLIVFSSNSSIPYIISKADANRFKVSLRDLKNDKFDRFIY